MGIGIFFTPIQSGILVSNQEGENLHFIPWNSTEFSIGWKHSVEQTPWEETFQIDENGQFRFVSSTYKSYGAGTPDVEGKVEFLPNGFIQVTEMERTLPCFSLFYVPTSNYYLKNTSKSIPLSTFVEPYTNVQLQYKKLKLYEWIIFKIKSFIKGGAVE